MPLSYIYLKPKSSGNSNLGVFLDIVATKIYYLIHTEQFIFYHPKYISTDQYFKSEARSETEG